MPILPANDNSKVLSFVFSKEDKTFKTVAEEFLGAIPTSNFFAAGCLILYLLEEPNLLSPEQRLRAAYMLLAAPRDMSGIFLPVLSQMAASPERSLAERTFICQLLSNATTTIANKTPSSYLRSFTSYTLDLPGMDVFYHQREGSKTSSSVAGSFRAGVPASGAISTAPAAMPESCDPSRTSDDPQTSLTTWPHGFAPPLLRLSPPVLATMPGELKWLHPCREPQLLPHASPTDPTTTAVSKASGPVPSSQGGSTSAAASAPPYIIQHTDTQQTVLASSSGTSQAVPPVCATAPTGSDPAGHVRPSDITPSPSLHELPSTSSSEPASSVPSSTLTELMGNAVKAPLLPSQQRTLSTQIAAESSALQHLPITSTSFPLLVQHNPTIAFEVLLHLMLLGQGAVDDLLLSLLRMDVSLQAMEVVNRLANAVELPRELMQLYLAHCMNHCQKETDTPTQNRLVRLVCVFLQRLIRDGVVEVEDIKLEATSFCVEFSRIQEAATLFRWMKTLQGEGASSNSAAAAGSSSDHVAARVNGM